MSYAQIDLKLQPRRKKLLLTTKPALVNRMIIVCINGRFNMLGGSLRIPASFCSVVGLRPSPGRVACGPKPLPFETLPVNRPMGRNVADVALMLDAQVGQHPGDPLSLPVPKTPYEEAVDRPIKPRRIGFIPDLGIAPVNREVRDICTKAAESWSDLGVAVEEACPDGETEHITRRID